MCPCKNIDFNQLAKCMRAARASSTFFIKHVILVLVILLTNNYNMLFILFKLQSRLI